MRTPTDLPVEAHGTEIMAAIESGALVLIAEPGAGKSSIVPLLAADVVARNTGRDSPGRPGKVVVLEPRRLAARATAHRLSQLIDDGDERARGAIGGVVGLSMRGERRVSDRTVIEVMTEAVLTNRLQRDPELPDVGVVVFDEFHERNVHSDLGLAMALEARATIRPDLALVVMSATLDAGPVASLLGTSRIVSVPGRTHPVETIHLPRPAASEWVDAVAAAARRALDDVTGDVLVFVPGRWEIAEVTRQLDGCGAEVVGLHGGSGSDTQRRVLTARNGRDGRAGAAGRRVIVATAVAETSVTLPGIEAVVDGGLLRRARFDPASGLGRLETVNVTRFSADQRRGRAGRLGPGVCYRLWSLEDHRLLDDAAPPEIVDGDPLPVAYELARWGDPDADDLPFLDHPGSERLRSARRLLADLGLVDGDGSLTERGVATGRLGVHPRLGALLLTASDLGLRELGSVVAALLDEDGRPTTPDLGAEVERRWRDLDGRAGVLRRRLDRAVPPAPAGRRGGSPGQSVRGRAQLAELGTLLASAWPDRVAMRRSGDPGRYLLASGREAGVDPVGPLGGAEFLVVAEADGEARRARIRRAVTIDRATVHAVVGHRVRWTEEVRWDDRAGAVRSERRQQLGAIELHSEPLAEPPPDQLTAALSEGLRRLGLDLLHWTERARALRHRLAWLHDVDPERWPAVDDDSLLARLDDWLDLSRCRTADDVAGLAVGSSLLSLLDWRQRAELDDLAPPELSLPDGRTRRLDYESGRPVLSVELQDLFGLDRHPTIGPRAAPVTIELLSPAGRPAQVTTDLPGFWRGSYVQVRRDLRGRYPKHRWPDEPWREEHRRADRRR